MIITRVFENFFNQNVLLPATEKHPLGLTLVLTDLGSCLIVDRVATNQSGLPVFVV